MGPFKIHYLRELNHIKQRRINTAAPLACQLVMYTLLCSTVFCPTWRKHVHILLSALHSGLQVKKHQQAVVGFLEANRISFQEVDITMLEEQRLWMYRNIPRDRLPEKGNPLPPQIFNEDRYCGVRLMSSP